MSAGTALPTRPPTRPPALLPVPVPVQVPVQARARVVARPGSAAPPAKPGPQTLPRRAAPVPSISLHVERLVLHGVPLDASDGARIERAFCREFERAVATRPQQLRRLTAGAMEALQLGPITLGAGPTANAGHPEQLGRELALALWRELAR